MKYGESTTPEIERIATAIVDAAFKVHKTLGPGLLESVYEACLGYELLRRGFGVARQRKVPIRYEGVRPESDLTLDLIIDERVIIEIKSVEALHPVHTAQATTYLKLTGKRLCLLINFNVPLIKDGIKRIVL